MQSSARTPPLNRAKWFFFRRAHLPSTCSRVMPTAEISFARSSKPSPNEKEVQNAKDAEIQTKKTSRHRRAAAAAHRCDHRRLWRPGRTEHEALAGVADRAPAARRRGGRYHRFQRDQNASGVAAFCAVADHHRNRFGRYQATSANSQPISSPETRSEDADKSIRFGESLRRRERRQSGDDREEVQSFLRRLTCAQSHR